MKSIHALNECIARKAFAELILDHECAAQPEYGLPSVVICRVLIDGWWNANIRADTREHAIEKFFNSEWN